MLGASILLASLPILGHQPGKSTATPVFQKGHPLCRIPPSPGDAPLRMEVEKRGILKARAGRTEPPAIPRFRIQPAAVPGSISRRRRPASGSIRGQERVPDPWPKCRPPTPGATSRSPAPGRWSRRAWLDGDGAQGDLRECEAVRPVHRSRSPGNLACQSKGAGTIAGLQRKRNRARMEPAHRRSNLCACEVERDAENAEIGHRHT